MKTTDDVIAKCIQLEGDTGLELEIDRSTNELTGMRTLVVRCVDIEFDDTPVRTVLGTVGPEETWDDAEYRVLCAVESLIEQDEEEEMRSYLEVRYGASRGKEAMREYDGRKPLDDETINRFKN